MVHDGPAGLAVAGAPAISQVTANVAGAALASGAVSGNSSGDTVLNPAVAGGSSPDAAEIGRAAAILEGGGLVAFPTETVYGLGADAENSAAVAKIFQIKGRPSNHPVIVHLAPEADLGYWVQRVPPAAQSLIDAFWPGPLTLILPRADEIPAAVAGGQNTIGVRCPSHPVAMALLRAFRGGQGGVAAPSANKFGHVSPTLAVHVREEFASELGGMLPLVLDGGASQVGIESTILDLSRWHSHGPVLLRPGHISTTQIATVIGREPLAPDASAPRASGTLASHYAPHTPVVLLERDMLVQSVRQLQQKGQSCAVLLHQMDAPAGVAALCRLPANGVAYAHGLYAALRELDQSNSFVILVEAPPHDAQWLGINDRLARAAHGSEAILAQFT